MAPVGHTARAESPDIEPIGKRRRVSASALEDQARRRPLYPSAVLRAPSLTLARLAHPCAESLLERGGSEPDSKLLRRVELAVGTNLGPGACRGDGETRA